MAGSVEEQLIVKSIREECPWDNLPKRLQVTLSTKEEWHRRYSSSFFSSSSYHFSLILLQCNSQDSRVLHQEEIAVELLFRPKGLQGGRVLRRHDALPQKEPCRALSHSPTPFLPSFCLLHNRVFLYTHYHLFLLSSYFHIIWLNMSAGSCASPLLDIIAT